MHTLTNDFFSDSDSRKTSMSESLDSSLIYTKSLSLPKITIEGKLKFAGLKNFNCILNPSCRDRLAQMVEHSLCKISTSWDRGSKLAVHQVFFKHKNLNLQKCLTSRLQKMSELS